MHIMEYLKPEFDYSFDSDLLSFLLRLFAHYAEFLAVLLSPQI